jgi:coproporphyrinogen III oxidase-like Fe-S oxidoreductase
MLDPPDLVFEFALNAFRLTDGFETSLFMEATGLPWSHLRGPLLAAQGDGLIQVQAGRVVPTALGRDFLDTLISRFLPSPSQRHGGGRTESPVAGPGGR